MATSVGNAASSRSTRRAVASGMVLGFAQRKFEIGLGLLAAYGRAAVEEAAERLARLEVVDQRLDGDARALEDERTADDGGIAGNDLFEGHDLDGMLSSETLPPAVRSTRNAEACQSLLQMTAFSSG